MPEQTLDQRRAEFAWKVTSGVSGEMSEAKSAPALIMTSGLMPTLAYYQEKKKYWLVNSISCWLREERTNFGAIENESKPDFKSIMERLQELESDGYRADTEEALLLLRWLKQFASVKEKKRP